MYNHTTGLEYNLTSDGSFRIIGVNYGSTTNPVVLKAIEATGVAFNDFEMKVNSMQDLSSKLSFTPSNATCPNNLEFNISPQTYSLIVTGNAGYQFTPSESGSYDVSMSGYLFFRNGTITVNRATNYVSSLSINTGYETISIPVGDADMLGDMLSRALKIIYYYDSAPDEYPVWVSDNENIVGPDATGRMTPKKKGTCTLTAQVYNPDGSVRLSASLTVKVGTFVTYINMLHSNISCNIGDDLTSYLPRTFEIQPADADNKEVTYSIIRGDGVLEQRSDGHIVAVSEGLAVIQITSKDSPDVSATLSVSVQNIKNAINVKQQTLTIVNKDNIWPLDITTEVSGNVTFLPESAYFANGYPTFTSGNTDVVTIEQMATTTGEAEISAKGLTTGTALITVTMEVPNLLEQSLAEVGTSIEPSMVTGTFTVIVQRGVIPATSISLPRYDSMNVGETLDLKPLLEVYPADADFDISSMTWSVGTPEGGEVRATVNDGVVTALAPGSITVYAKVAGTTLEASIDIDIFQPATGLAIRPGYETITVTVGDKEALTEALTHAYVLTPANSTDGVNWTYSVSGLVQEEYEWFIPVKAGTTKVTYYIGSQTNPRLTAELTLVIKPLTEGIQLPASVNMNVGEQLTLADLVTVVPEGSTLDKSTIVWTVEGNEGAGSSASPLVSIADGKLTALNPGSIKLTATVPGTDYKASTTIHIYSPATAMSVKQGYETVTVFEGDNDGLTEKMSQAIVLTPANTTDEYEWMVADKSIVDYERGFFYPLKPGTTKATAYIGDKANPRLTAEVTIIVERRTVPATSISLPRYDSMNVGETLDLKPLLEVYPENADFDISSVTWSVGTPEGGEVRATVNDGVVTALAPGSITVYAKVAGTTLEASIDIDIFQPATGLAIRPGYETITVTVGDKEALTEALTHAYVLTPANSTDGVNWTYSVSGLVQEEYEWFIPVKAGTTKVTYYIGSQVNPRLTAELTLIIEAAEVAPTELTITIPDPLVVGVEANITVKGNAGAVITPSSLKVNENNPLGWKALQPGDAMKKSDGSVTIAVTPLCPGDLKVSVSQGTVKSKTVDVHVGVAATLVKGWQWKTLWGADLQNVENMYGMNVDDIRSQLTIGSRDEDGYFGSTSTKELTAYKIKAANDISASDAKVFVGGTILTTKAETKLYNGWTWIPYPYVHAFTPDELGINATLGDRIVSKDEGFAEYDSDGWTGDLETLKPYESYLYYNNLNAEATIEWQPEPAMAGHASRWDEVGHAIPADAPAHSLSQHGNSPRCDKDVARRFRDNMTVIAQLSPLTSHLSPLTCRLSAFVGGECRGVSHTVGGLFFITVHADAGEEISFRLYDEETGQYIDVEQKFMMTPALGTLRSPLQLTTAEVQGVMEMERQEPENMRIEEYDLRGVLLQRLEAQPNTSTLQSTEASPSKHSKKGSLVIRRQSNGQYRKVLNK